MSDLHLRGLSAKLERDYKQLPAALRRHVGFDARSELTRGPLDQGEPGDYQDLLTIELGIYARLRADPEVLDITQQLALAGLRPVVLRDLPDGKSKVEELDMPEHATETDRHFAEEAMKWGRLVMGRTEHLKRNHPDQTVLWNGAKVAPLLRDLPLVESLEPFYCEIHLARMIAHLTAAKLLGPGKIAGRSRAIRNVNRFVIDELGREGFGPQTMAFETGLPESTVFRLQAEADRIYGRRRR